MECWDAGVAGTNTPILQQSITPSSFAVSAPIGNAAATYAASRRAVSRRSGSSTLSSSAYRSRVGT
jgi:hypothetical protein